MALANLIGNYSSGKNAIASDILTDLTSLLTRVNNITSEQINASQVLESHVAGLAISTAKLAAGTLSADVTGRTKMADGYLTRAKFGTDAKVSYLKVVDEQTSGTEGGTATKNLWTELTLNTIYDNPDSIAASLSSNQVTLPAGSYYFQASSIFFGGVSDYRTRLYNVTDAGVQTDTGGNDLLSSTGYNSVAVNVSSLLSGAFTLASAKAVSLQYYVTSTNTTDGLGKAGAIDVEIYRLIEFWKYSD